MLFALLDLIFFILFLLFLIVWVIVFITIKQFFFRPPFEFMVLIRGLIASVQPFIDEHPHPPIRATHHYNIGDLGYTQMRDLVVLVLMQL